MFSTTPLLSKEHVARLIGLHPGSLMRLVRAGRFPRPLHTSGTAKGRVRWRSQDVENWINERAAA